MSTERTAGTECERYSAILAKEDSGSTLSTADRSEMARHLGSCAQCRVSQQVLDLFAYEDQPPPCVVLKGAARERLVDRLLERAQAPVAADTDGNPRPAARHWATLVAACLLVVIAGAWWMLSRAPQVPLTLPNVAELPDAPSRPTVLVVTGATLPVAKPLAVGQRLTEGAVIRTAQGRTAFSLGPVGRVTAGHHTRLKLTRIRESKLVLGLQAGRVNISYPPRLGRAGLTVTTPHGRILVTGTRFSVSMNRAGCHVAVYQGQVRTESRAGTVFVGAGETLTLGKMSPSPIGRRDQHLDSQAGAGPGTAPTRRPSPRRLPRASASGRSTSRAGMVETPQAAVPGQPPLNPPQLLAGARTLQSKGDAVGAAKLLRRLIQLAPGRSEALTARVSLGYILLDNLKQPAPALSQFKAYLRASPRGTLAEEAALGRIRALRSLGRTAAEKTATQAFLRRYPTALQTPALRRRLRQLGGR